MSSLGVTVGALARLKRERASPGASSDERLREVADFGANPGALRMLTYAPRRLEPNAPLVVVLHGCAQTAQAYAQGAGWLALAEEFGFVVLCPEQTRANNANLCFNWFEPGDTARGAGEVASIRAMIAAASLEYGADPGRVFVTGLSAGAAMAAALLATYPDVFAAGALIAGLAHGAAGNVQDAFAAMYQGRSRPAPDWGDRVRASSPATGAWPRVSIWHGDDDTTVRPAAADDLVRQWTNVHGVDESAGVDEGASSHAHRVWRRSDGRVVVELHRIKGMSHGAPLKSRGDGSYGTPGPFLLEVGVSSSLAIAQFWDLTRSQNDLSTPASRERADLATPRAGMRVDPMPLPPSPAGVIAKALRGAGLLK